MDRKPYTYVGTELHLFAKATNWKAYWWAQLMPYVRGSVLEVGAGIGANSRLFARSCLRLVCLEPDVELITELRARLQALPDVEVTVGTVADLPTNDRFDAILYIDVLEHIRADREELAQAASRLLPGGHLIVISPAHQWLFSPFDRSIGHYRRYSKAALRATGPAGLQLASLRYLDAAGMLASVGNRLLLRESLPTERQILFWDKVLVPVSLFVDPLLRYSVGKSVLGIWRRDC